MPQRPLSEEGGQSPTFSTRFAPEQIGRVVELANESGITRGEFIRRAVERELERAGAEAAGE